MDTKRLSPVSALTAAVLLTGGLVLAGCSSGSASSSAGSTGSIPASTSPTTTAPSVTTTTAPPYTYIGTANTDLQGGGSITEAYNIGSPEHGNPPPSDASGGANACFRGNSTIFDTAVYVPGSLTLTYTGNITQAIPVNGEQIWTDEVADNPAPVIMMAIEADGSW